MFLNEIKGGSMAYAFTIEILILGCPFNEIVLYVFSFYSKF